MEGNGRILEIAQSIYIDICCSSLSEQNKKKSRNLNTVVIPMMANFFRNQEKKSLTKNITIFFS